MNPAKRYRDRRYADPWGITSERAYFGTPDRDRVCPGCGQKVREGAPAMVVRQTTTARGIYLRWWHVDCAREYGYETRDK